MPTKPWSQIVHKKDVREGFAELFAGRVDACGTPNGGCLRVPSSEFHLLWEQHLNGAAPIGIYPVRPGNMCRWGAVDLDIRSDKKPSGDYVSEEECHTAAVNLQKVLSALRVTSWIERTRSCGRHVWIFCDAWVSAATMRRALLVAATVAGTSTREVNPKSTELKDGQVGNYVRVMYPGALARPDVAGGAAGGRRVLSGASAAPKGESAHLREDGDDGSGRGRACHVCSGCGTDLRDQASERAPQGAVRVAGAGSVARSGSNDDAAATYGAAASREDTTLPRCVAIDEASRPLCVSCFVSRALISRVSPDVLEAIASRYVSTKGSRAMPSLEFEDNFAEPARRVLPRLNRAGRSVFANGPNDGDRSRGLSYLARQARNSGLTPSQALTLLAAAHWQKFRGRHDEEQRLREIVEWAWQ